MTDWKKRTYCMCKRKRIISIIHKETQHINMKKTNNPVEKNNKHYKQTVHRSTLNSKTMGNYFALIELKKPNS